MRATVYREHNSMKSAAVKVSIHVELKAISVRSGSRILKICFLYVSALRRTSSRVRVLRVSDLPEGSPIMPVKSPMRKMT